MYEIYFFPTQRKNIRQTGQEFLPKSEDEKDYIIDRIAQKLNSESVAYWELSINGFSQVKNMKGGEEWLERSTNAQINPQSEFEKACLKYFL